MIIQGQFNKAVVFTNVIEQTAIEQIRDLCNDPAFAANKIRVMPDVHTGAGCTIGMTMTLCGKVVPDMVGVDIGCGMEVVKIAERDVDFKEVDKFIRENIPSGKNVRKKAHAYAALTHVTDLKCAEHVDLKRALLSVGTLGGGNHFIELDRDDNGNVYIVIHSGSRHLGVEVATYYQDLAYNTLRNETRARGYALVKKMKAEGRQRELQEVLKKARRENEVIQHDMAYLTGTNMSDYLEDMTITQDFAAKNRRAIADSIVEHMGFHITDRFTTIHNYVDVENMILRKGAVSARKGEKLLIPINMRDGSLICIGKGNEHWNQSAPHGAGRLLSRTKAFATLSLETFKKEMEGIYTTSVSKGTLDESPMAYKRIEDVTNNVTPTVKIKQRIYPIYNFKSPA